MGNNVRKDFHFLTYIVLYCFNFLYLAYTILKFLKQQNKNSFGDFNMRLDKEKELLDCERAEIFSSLKKQVFRLRVC